MTEQEEWRAIPNEEGYEVSNYGRARSFKRKVEGQILKPFQVGDKKRKKYPAINVNGKRIARIHSLVALVFIGECPKGLIVDHIDNNGQNNHADNLQYITYQENNTKDRDESNYPRDANNRFTSKKK
jgi:hypothetical protein